MSDATRGKSREFERLVEKLAAGSSVAIEQLVRDYGPHIIRAVRRSLSNDLRGKFDSADFTQAVWKSFFCIDDFQNQIRTPSQLVKYLTVMARNEVIDEGRRRHTQKYDQRLEQPHHAMIEPKSNDPTPSQLAIAREQLNRISGGKTNEAHIVNLRMNGLTHREIAEQLGVSDKTVQRALRKIKSELEDDETQNKRHGRHRPSG